MVCALCIGNWYADHHFECWERLDKLVRESFLAVPQESAAQSEREQEWDDIVAPV